MKKHLFVVITALAFIACNPDPKSTDQKDREQQEQLTKQAQEKAGMPAIINFQEKKMLKMIYELRDNGNLVNYVYFVNEYQGKLIFLGKCIGYGMPYATQYSNPNKIDDYGHIMPQAEPNGLFMPASAEGTWVMMFDKKGEVHPVYIEPRVIVSPFDLLNN